MALTTIKTGGLADNSVTDAKVADAITVTGAQTGITQVGTLTAGTWNGTAIASAYLDADTAHLSGSTFTGSVQISHGTTPDFTLNDTNGTTNKRVFRISGGGDAVYFEGRNNDNSGAGAVGGDGSIMSMSLTDASTTFSGNITMPAGNSFFLDGGGNSKIEEFATDKINIQAGGENLVLLGNGSSAFVGVGTTTPAQAITIKHPEPTILFIHEHSSDEEIGFIGDCANFLTGSSPSATSFGVRSTGDFRIGTGGNNLRMTVQSDGKVGIGCAPDEMLHVISDSKFDGTIRVGDGSAAAPSYRFINDVDTGIYWAGTNAMGFVTGGTSRLEIRADGTSHFAGDVTSAGRLYSTDGSASYPAYSFSSEVDTGMYKSGGNEIGFATAGVHRMSIQANGTSTLFMGAAAAQFAEYESGGIIWLDGVNGDLSGGDYWGLQAVNGGGSFRIKRAGTTKVTIDSSGNMDIAGSLTESSDIRLKENIEAIPNALSKVNQMRGVHFNKKGSDEKLVGMIADEVEKIIPELVTTATEKGELDTEALDNLKSLRYSNMVAVLVEAVKELSAEVEALKNG
mgnify:CR=1 FL=1